MTETPDGPSLLTLDVLPTSTDPSGRPKSRVGAERADPQGPVWESKSEDISRTPLCPSRSYRKRDPSSLGTTVGGDRNHSALGAPEMTGSRVETHLLSPY